MTFEDESRPEQTDQMQTYIIGCLESPRVQVFVVTPFGGVLLQLVCVKHIEQCQHVTCKPAHPSTPTLSTIAKSINLRIQARVTQADVRLSTAKPDVYACMSCNARSICYGAASSETTTGYQQCCNIFEKHTSLFLESHSGQFCSLCTCAG